MACFVPRVAWAQHLPMWTVELGVVIGPRTERADGVYFRGNQSAVSVVAVNYRLGPPRSTALYARAELNPVLMQGDEVSICLPAPNGSCYRAFENNNGAALHIELRHRVIPHLVLGAATGAGSYNDHVRTFAEAALHLSDESHAGLRLAARYSTWRSAGERYWFAPITGSVQLFW